MKDVASKTMDGISDLVVFAPIKEGFINAFETITYASRLELVANALNRLRTAAREYERLNSFTDVTERILGLLDFRVGVIDEGLFGLARLPRGERVLKPRRYLYLTATFEGGFEPYMRQIWRPLGPFLDLLFCNCDDYITATEHSFAEYIQWVRDNQMDSAIFYNTTGITVRDQKYLSSFERLQRAQFPKGPGAPVSLAERDSLLAGHAMAYPDDETARARAEHPDKAVAMGLEALNVLYKLTDYYPPGWLTGPVGGPGRHDEGHRLLRATRELLRGWDTILKGLDADAEAHPGGRSALVLQAYEEPLNWYRTGVAHVESLKPAAPKIPEFDRGQVQSGILKPHGSRERPISQGALLLFSVRDAQAARKAIAALTASDLIRFGDAAGPEDDKTVFGNIAFTAQGLLELGLDPEVCDCLPKEFRDGLAQRSSQVGDLRENHPRNWMLPKRNGPAFLDAALAGRKLPPVELSEIDFAIQLRGFGREAVEAQARKIGSGMAPGATLESIDWLYVENEGGLFRDHFGYVDGVSQPRPDIPNEPFKGLERDRIALGEVLQGHANDRGDGPPDVFTSLDRDKSGVEDTAWRSKPRREAMNLLKDGSFLVIRKIGEDVAAFDKWLDDQKAGLAVQLGVSPQDARALLKAAVMGRDEHGKPLSASATGHPNDFDFEGDGAGLACPHAAHIRRANPRRWKAEPAPTESRREFDRPTPRLVRRGMLFGPHEHGARGLMFIAYVSSIAEQYEVIQRWLNGGNPTDVASADNDPLTGVRPKDGPGAFRFVVRRQGQADVVVRVDLPAAVQPIEGAAEPGRHPFTPLYWGLYLFTPSLAGLQAIAKFDGAYRPMREMLEHAVGKAWIERLGALSKPVASMEWKRLIEDFIAKDPSEQDISPHLWSAVRLNYNGAINLRMPLDRGEAGDDTRSEPDNAEQNVILCCGEDAIDQVLSDWENFSSETQLSRIIDHAGPIYVTQQPDNKYNEQERYSGLDYHAESAETNRILFEYEEEDAFLAGYHAGKAVMDRLKAATFAISPSATSFKIELRRQYIQPAISVLWKLWYGFPDEQALHTGSWSWKELVEKGKVKDKTKQRDQAFCPGDFMAPSRGAVFPRPNASIDHYAEKHGAAIREAGLAFVKRLRANPDPNAPPLIQKLFAAYPDPDQDDVLARNIVGTMIGAIPPMDANLRNILLEWLLEKRLWRHQAAFKAALAGQDVKARAKDVREVLAGPISQAMCKRPAPDLLFRTATRPTKIKRKTNEGEERVATEAQEKDLVVVSLASASQWSLMKCPHGDVSIIFGGKRTKPLQGYAYGQDGVTPVKDGAVHACPATKMAMGGMTGILAAFLDAGTIQALPASLIVRISDW